MAREQRELRKMNRVELIEIIYHLQQDLIQLESENKDLKKQLEDRHIRIANAGSIAQAALALNGVFEAAQAAADQYVASVTGKKPSYETAERVPQKQNWEVIEQTEQSENAPTHTEV